MKTPTPERPPRPRGRFGALRRDQRGQALVEFALVAIPLFLVLFGVIDFARALNYYNDLTQLAGQGARAAAVNLNPDGTAASGKSIQQQVYNNLDSPEMKQAGNHAEVCITLPNGTNTTTGDPVVVTTSYTFKFIPLVHPVGIGLSSSQTERFEGVTPSYSAGCYP
jgi:Flp pilus assembly protein TadG